MNLLLVMYSLPLLGYNPEGMLKLLSIVGTITVILVLRFGLEYLVNLGIRTYANSQKRHAERTFKSDLEIFEIATLWARWNSFDVVTQREDYLSLVYNWAGDKIPTHLKYYQWDIFVEIAKKEDEYLVKAWVESPGALNCGVRPFVTIENGNYLFWLRRFARIRVNRLMRAFRQPRFK